MSDANANKEKWAAKNQGRTLHPGDVAAAEAASAKPKLPPGQHVPRGWPRLDLGFTPDVNRETWSLTVRGLVERPQSFTWAQYQQLPRFEQVADMHCVTTWSVFDYQFKGVRFSDLCAHVGVQPEARHVYFTSFDGYSTNLELDCCMDEDVMLVDEVNGQPLDDDHGGPVRMLVPKRYLWKSAKWIREIIFLAEDKQGYWEVRGYHNRADPWKEERFS